jgi:hypothetical protein
MTGEPVPVRNKNCSSDFQNRFGLRPVSSDNSYQENVMPWSRTGNHLTRAAFVIPPASTGLLWATAAAASQGPGGGPGTAGGFTQLAMAILVYGTCALVVLAGLIGAVRPRSP